MTITAPVLSYLQDASKTAPMLLIETPTTLGRTYQGYKRGGKPEAREKILEESLGAVVWLFGIKVLNKIGDVFGEKVLGLKDIGTDVGKDSLRNPFGHVKNKKALTAGYKFGKIALSAVLGTIAMGILVPKIKVAMSSALRKKQGLEPYPDKNDKNGVHIENWADRLVGHFIKGDNRPKNKLKPMISMQDFVQNAKSKGNPSFKGNPFVDGVLCVSHNIENNTICRLLTTDFGMLAGRVANSRTRKEAIEYATRDSASSVFYLFAAPVFSAFLRKVTNTPNVAPKGALETAEHLKGIISSSDKPVTAGFFSSKILSKEAREKAVEGISFSDKGTIKLSDFNAQTAGKYAQKADLMSKLQPLFVDAEGAEYSILSKRQVADILSDSELSDPGFLKRAINKATGGRSDDIKAFVSRKKLEGIRDSFDKFAVGLENYAKRKTKDGIITSSVVDDYAKYLNRKNLAIHLGGIGFAVFGLAYLIPKFQYFVSEKLTGQKEFMAPENPKETKQPNVQ